SRKRAAARKQAVAKRDSREHVNEDQQSNSNHENEAASPYHAKTPIKQPSARARKASADEVAPLDTLVAVKRTRRVFAEENPSPEPVAPRGRQRASSRGRGASKAASKRTAVSVKGKQASAAATKSGHDDDDEDGYEDQDIPRGSVFDEDGSGSTASAEVSNWNGDRNGAPLDSEDDAILATPTKRRGRAAASLGSPSTRLTRSLSKNSVEVEHAANAESSPLPGRDGRKRRTGVSDETKADIEAGSRATRKRSRPSKASVYVEIDSDDMSREAEQPLAETPVTRSSRTVAAGKAKATNAKGTKSGVLRDLKHEVYVDIVSPSKFELSRSKIQSSGRQSSALGASKGKEALEALPFSSPASKDGEKWQKKYEELFALRQTKPEQELDKFRQSASTRFDASDKLIDKLRKEIASLKKSKGKGKPSEDDQPKTSQASSAPAKTANEKELEKQVALLRKDVEALTQDVLVKDEAIERLEQHRKLTETSTDYNLREKLRLIQELSGLSIDDVVPEDDGVSYVCRQSGPAADATFVLTAFDDIPNEYQYTPCGNTTTLDVLPDYLKESMSFAKPAAN
ncbi:hypothetical protein LPJ75_004981, partial [Coemansia sp. RSA 2598]